MSHSLAASRLPRAVHPIAWWIWAIGLATAASRTTNPLLLALIIAVAGVVVAARRTEAPWARAFKWYLLAGLVVIAIRVVFRIVLGGEPGPEDHIVFTIPHLPLPGFMSGVRIGGAVSAESIVAAVYDGLRLATILCCIGAANTLANPKRALRALPAALYELGVTITVAVTVAPQIIDSVRRVNRARKLRGDTTRGRHAVRRIAMPVLHDALDRSFQLAAAMDSRGYGRSDNVPLRVRRVTATVLLGGLLGLCLGTYGLLDTSTPRFLGAPAFALGLALCASGLWLGGRRVHRTSYRPDPWAPAEWATVISAAIAVVATIVTGAHDASALNPSVYPLAWPTLAMPATVGILCAMLPAVLTPPPPVPATPSAAAAVAAPDRQPVGAHA